MAELNVDLPIWDCKIRSEYLYDLESHHGEYEFVCVFGLASVYGRALGFHLMTHRGAQLARIPISAIVHKEHDPHIPLHHLQLWDCFSYDVSITAFDFIGEMRCKVILRDKLILDGTYMFTVDWYGNNDAEEPGEDGHKNAHVIALDCGCYAAQPNNRIIWREPSLVSDPWRPELGERPAYLTNTHKWKCEIDSKWTAEDSYAFFYDDNYLLEPGEKFLDPETRIKLGRLRALKDAEWPSYEEEKKKLQEELGIDIEKQL